MIDRGRKGRKVFSVVVDHQSKDPLEIIMCWIIKFKVLHFL